LGIKQMRNKILTGEWVLSQHARIRAGQRCVKDFEMVIAIANGEIYNRIIKPYELWERWLK